MIVSNSHDISCHGNLETLLSTPIFNSVTLDQLDKIFHCLKARYKKLDKNEILTDDGNSVIIVLSGCISYTFFDEDAEKINMNNFKKGDTFFTSVILSPEYTAIEDSEILVLDMKKLLNGEESTCPLRQKISQNVMTLLHKEKMELEKEVRILAQRKLRDKIRVYFRDCSIKKNGEIKIDYTRKELAEHLYADRSALSRELGRMRDDGIIECDGANIRLLDESFLVS